MTKKKTVGRPRAVIDWDTVDRYLQAQCEGTAIAGILGIHEDTLYHACERDKKMRFSAYLHLKRGEGKELLRAKMYQQAMNGDKTMLVWLSKQYLGMTDKHETVLPEGMEDITVRVLRRGEAPTVIEAAEVIKELPVGGNGGETNKPIKTEKDDTERETE